MFGQATVSYGGGSMTRRALLPLAVLAVGVCATVPAAAYLKHVQDRDTRERFAHRSHEATQTITNALDRGGSALLAGRGLFDGSDEVNEREFGRFVDALDLPQQYPGVHAVAFVRADREVAYVGPAGRDASSVSPADDAAARAAQDEARDTAQPVTTAPTRLAGDPQGATAFVVYLPVYRGGGRPARLEQRRELLAGWLADAYRGGDLVGGSATTAVESALYFGDTLVGVSPGFARALDDATLVRDQHVTLYGATWLVRTVAPRGFTPLSYAVAPWIV